ncbi:hypothetical protein CB1_000825001 [Camelus ferus]|nr:hypothetical protein CB1_000825001 [Camelus ferus]
MGKVTKVTKTIKMMEDILNQKLTEELVYDQFSSKRKGTKQLFLDFSDPTANTKLITTEMGLQSTDLKVTGSSSGKAIKAEKSEHGFSHQ